MVSVLTLRCCLYVPPRYTTNTTEFPYNLWLYQKYYDIERIGWGLYPTHTWNNSARPLRANLCVSSFRRFVWFGACVGPDSSALDLSLQPPLFPRLNSPIPLPIPRLTRKRVWLCEHLICAGENGALGPSNATAASDAFVASRMDDFKAYGSATIAVWVNNPVRIQIGRGH